MLLFLKILQCVSGGEVTRRRLDFLTVLVWTMARVRVFLAVARGDEAIDVGGGKTDEGRSWDRAAEVPSISKTKHTRAFRGRARLRTMSFR